MKIAYVGIDLLASALHALCSIDACEIIEIFTCETDNITEFNIDIIQTAKELDIPCSTAKVSQGDLERLKQKGCDMLICAGYYHKLPIDSELPMLNIHPSYLPEGRGAWPMPCMILDGTKTGGVSIHKMTCEMDEGDIILQNAFEISSDETLKSYMIKVNEAVRDMIPRLISDYPLLSKKAGKQGIGSYYPCPTEQDWTVTYQMCDEELDRILRAFYGYECFWVNQEAVYELIGGRLLGMDELPSEGEQYVYQTDSGRVLVAESIRLIRKTEKDCSVECEYESSDEQDFLQDITIDMADQIRAIGSRQWTDCSAQSFASLFIWKRDYRLSIILEEDWYAVKCGSMGDNTWMFPRGDEEKCRAFVARKKKEKDFQLVYLTDEQKAMIEFWFPSGLELREDPASNEYICDISMHMELQGKAFQNVRNHWSKANREHTLSIRKVDDSLEIDVWQILDAWKANQRSISNNSKKIYCYAEQLLFQYQEYLDAELYIVYVDEVPFSLVGGYALSDEVFDLSLAKEKYHLPGISYAAKHLLFQEIKDRYSYVNLEEDLGNEGLRRMKKAMVPVKILNMWIASWSLG